jgi:hypothetical protein
MIERRRRNLDRPFLRRVGIGRQTLPSSSRSRCNHKTLIFERVVALFLDQRGNIFIFQKEFVEPCDLRQHLQIGEVARLKIFFRFLGRYPCSPETLEKLPVARIAPNQVRRIRLKKILQGKLPLSCVKSFAGLAATFRNGSCAVPAT